ncbi:sugar phosphate isomerase/epimerase [Paenibacillus sp. WST5]|uniref:Sugar phosphate isomerase/epimerase n=2 Tax=Paenibacillus sedimenti TaxID=2770274 RepID=A0A926QK40_9BACL|nr:sugar phosphate isomerase/epimerase [Paenibacillus sedimenti]
MSWWTMNGLGEGGREWSIEEKFRHIAEAGFDGINGFVPLPEEAAVWRRLLAQYGLSFSVNAYPRTSADLINFIGKVKSYGPVSFINAQVLTPFLIDQDAEALLTNLHTVSSEAGIPLFIETHRGTITQDLIRTVQYVNRLDFLRLTIDFSHYVVAGEMHTISDEAEDHLQALLARTSSIHARVSNGEQIQVNVGDDGGHRMMSHFERWWASGMRHWLQAANPGDVFPFVCELGPAPYAITIDEHAERKIELSDRWSQSLLFAERARTIWKQIQ